MLLIPSVMMEMLTFSVTVQTLLGTVTHSVCGAETHSCRSTGRHTYTIHGQFQMSAELQNLVSLREAIRKKTD